MRVSILTGAIAFLHYQGCFATKRGLAEGGEYDTNCIDFVASNLSWTYNWGMQPEAPCTALGAASFVPMAWGKSSSSQTPYANATTLLGFNEPNVSQSNMSPAQAAALWPQLEAMATQYGFQLGSPAAAPCGSGPTSCNGGDSVPWFDAFFGNCTNCRVDFLATHYYGCETAGLSAYLDSLQKYKLPVWLTEFNCGGSPANASEAKHAAYMQVAIPLLESRSDVVRYSWMAGRNAHTPGSQLFQTVGGNAVPTALGHLYLTL
jgi:hypothetical protein